MQAFKRYDKQGSGFITPVGFNSIMMTIKLHLLTPQVKDNLVAVSDVIPNSAGYSQ